MCIGGRSPALRPAVQLAHHMITFGVCSAMPLLQVVFCNFWEAQIVPCICAGCAVWYAISSHLLPRGRVFSFVSFFNQQLPLVTASPWEDNGQCLYAASGCPYQLAQIRSNCSEQQVSDHRPAHLGRIFSHAKRLKACVFLNNNPFLD